MDNLIERLHNTRKTLMSGDGEWADAEAMDQCVTEAIDTITRLEAESERLRERLEYVGKSLCDIAIEGEVPTAVRNACTTTDTRGE